MLIWMKLINYCRNEQRKKFERSDFHLTKTDGNLKIESLQKKKQLQQLIQQLIHQFPINPILLLLTINQRFLLLLYHENKSIVKNILNMCSDQLSKLFSCFC